MEFLESITTLHWFLLGLGLLAAEALGCGGFLLGAAVAALANSLILWVFPDLGVTTSLVIFCIGSVLATAVYYRLFKQEQDDHPGPTLHNRAHSMIGHRFSLATPVLHGHGRIQIGDTFWKVIANEDLDEGMEVEISRAKDDMTLELQRAP